MIEMKTKNIIDKILNGIGWLMYIIGMLITIVLAFGVLLLLLYDGTWSPELAEMTLECFVIAMVGIALMSRTRQEVERRETDKQDRLITEAAEMANERLRERGELK